MFLSTFTLDQLASKGLVPRQVSWIPELLSGLAIVIVVLHGALAKRLMIAGKYLVFFGFASLLMTSSIIINDVQPGTIFVGARTYLKFIPFFLLPVVYDYSEEQLRRQLVMLAVLGVIQLPISLLQRFVFYAGWGTGDVISGTFGGSGVLTVMLVSFISIVVAMYLRGRLSLVKAASLLLIYIIPTGINETKVTVILLPMAVGLSFYFMPNRKESLRATIPFVFLGGLVFFMFIGLYEGLYASRVGGGLIGFLTDPGAVEHHLYGGAAESKNIREIDREPPAIGISEKAEEKRTSRIDGIIVAWKVLSGDLTRLLVGVGIGNVTDSFLGPKFVGKYAYYTREYGAGFTDLSVMLWELGLLGVMMSYVFLSFIAKDAIALAKSPSLYGALGQGWVGVVAIIAVTILYQNNIGFNPISYLFWFFSGHIVAARVRQSWQESRANFGRE